MHPPTDSPAPSTTLSARATRRRTPCAAAATQAGRARVVASPLLSLLREEDAARAEGRAAGRGKGFGLRLETLVTVGVLLQDLIENGQEARVLGEGPRSGRDLGCGADG